VTRQSAIDILTSVTVAPVTSTIRDVPSHVPLSIEDGLFGDCVVNCDSLLTIPKESVKRPIARLTAEKLAEVQAAIRFALDL
jgi:mRNA interferase MazF